MYSTIRLSCCATACATNYTKKNAASKFSNILTRSFSSTNPDLTKYGFIGLGQMGKHMSRNLHGKLEPQDQLFVYDVSPEAVSDVLKSCENQDGRLQAKGCSSAREVGEKAEVIMTMLPEGKHVRETVADIVNHLGPNSEPKQFVDSSTIDLQSSQSLTEIVDTWGRGSYLDAPVSGGAIGAENATLSFMVGREKESDLSEELKRMLRAMGAKIFYMGKPGAGLAAKLANNYLLAVTNIATADAFNLAKRFGLDMQVFAELVAQSTGNSWASATNCPVPGVRPNTPSSRGYAGGFATRLTRKDIVLAVQCAETLDQPLFLGELGRKIYDKACEDPELAGKDLAVFYKWLSDMTEKHQMVKL